MRVVVMPQKLIFEKQQQNFFDVKIINWMMLACPHTIPVFIFEKQNNPY